MDAVLSMDAAQENTRREVRLRIISDFSTVRGNVVTTVDNRATGRAAEKETTILNSIMAAAADADDENRIVAYFQKREDGISMGRTESEENFINKIK